MYLTVCFQWIYLRRNLFKDQRNFVKDIEDGSYLHLAVVVAKKNGCVVSTSADCIGKIVEKTSELSEYPENIDGVCNRFCCCYTKICLLFSRIKELKICFRPSLIQDLYSNRHTRDICNKCMNCFIISLKSFLMRYVINEHWKIVSRIWKNIWSVQIKTHKKVSENSFS